MNTIYRTKHKCKVCHDYIRIKYNNPKYNYYYCKKCDIYYVLDRSLDRIVRSYRKVDYYE